MKSFRQHKRTAAVFVIFSMIFALALLIPYIRIYRLTHSAIVANPGNFVNIIKEMCVADKTNLWVTIAFGVFSFAWLCLSIIANIKISRTSRIFGGYFGGVLGRIILLVEFLGYVAIWVVLFVQL